MPCRWARRAPRRSCWTRLREQRPGLRILLTHGTATGRAEGERLLRAGDVQAWLPWDTPGAVRAFPATTSSPALGLLMETEVWPNLVAACQARGVPLVLANARLSEKSLPQARRLARLSRPAYGALAAVWAQTEADAAAPARRPARTVQGVFGNLKFDATPDAGAAGAGPRLARGAGPAGGDVRQLARRRGSGVLRSALQRRPVARPCAPAACSG